MRRVFWVVVAVGILLGGAPALAQEPTPVHTVQALTLPSGGVAVVEATITYGDIFIGSAALLVAAVLAWGHVRDFAQMMTKK